MNTFTDMHGRTICDGAEVYFNGQFPAQVPTENHIRNGIAIIEDDKLVFAVIIDNQLRGIGLYWEFDNEPCYDLIISDKGLTMMPTRIKYRGITAEITQCRRGYKCLITDVHGNDVSWFIRANTMTEAIAKAERHFDNAIRYLRGFIILPVFLERVEEYDV